jgi:LruC domain-containing protein
MYFQEDNDSYLEDKSLITVAGNFYVPKNGAVWDGPHANGEFAIVKIAGDIKMAKWDALIRKTNGTVCLDWANIAEGVNHSTIDNKEGIESDEEAVRQMLAKMSSDQISEASAPTNIMIPEGDCTGDGYNTNPPPVTPVIEVPNAYRYCFEDNFPQPGDYDFNDCVITVTPERDGNTVELTVSLDAVGATKHVGAAMLINGISDSDITSITCDGNMDEGYNGAPMIYAENRGDNVFALSDDQKGYDDQGQRITSLVLRLYNDAHFAMSGNDKSSERKFYNTVSPDDPKAAESYVDNTKPSRTIKYTIVLKDEDTAKKFDKAEIIDVFIVEKHNGRNYEVHTREYKFYQVLNAYYNSNKFTEYAGTESENYPWAISVPTSTKNVFHYPIEWHSISGTKIREGVDESSYGYTRPAYQSFKNWAVDKNQDKDWYLYPTEGLVY